MKIVDYKTFCKMPAGTIFSPYEPCALLEELAIKVDAGKPCIIDGEEENIFVGVMPLEPYIDEYDRYNVGDTAKAKFEIYDGTNADYCDYESFLILDEEDIEKLISVIRWAQNGCK